MDDGVLFPKYIPRAEEQQISDEATRVSADRHSRVVLVYGPGGIGKTSLIRQLAQSRAADEAMIWLNPIDVDDPEYWLLSNLEQLVARQLDPDEEYFGP